jgi:hypothetical protein
MVSLLSICRVAKPGITYLELPRRGCRRNPSAPAFFDLGRLHYFCDQFPSAREFAKGNPDFHMERSNINIGINHLFGKRP